MLLHSKHIPEIHRLLKSEVHGDVQKIQGREISLSVALYLALAHRSFFDNGNLDLAWQIEQLDLPRVAQMSDRVNQKDPQIVAEPFGAPEFDFYRIDSKASLLSEQWVLFYDRFRRSAARGRTSVMFRAVSGVLDEMGDNVVWHAFKSEKETCPALAAFHVTNTSASFCVADWGQGFLRSLQRSSVWRGLTTEREALEAVIRKNATSRDGEREGGGYKQLFNSLLDFNGLVLLRSGGCAYRLENCGAVRRDTSHEAFNVPGSSITVVISSDGQPTEQSLK
jgi:hypothetical protein